MGVPTLRMYIDTHPLAMGHRLVSTEGPCPLPGGACRSSSATRVDHRLEDNGLAYGFEASVVVCTTPAGLLSLAAAAGE